MGNPTEPIQQVPQYATETEQPLIKSAVFPPPIGELLRGQPTNRPRRSIILTTHYTEHETKPDAQGHREAISLNGDSRNEYQASCQGKKSEPDTEPDREELDRADCTPSGLHRESQAA